MEKTIIYTDNAPEPIGPYSQAVLVGETLYVSGQLGIDPSDNILANNIAGETDQVMKNIWAILNAADMDFSNIVQCSIFLMDMDDFDIVNATYSKYFDSDPPARQTIEVAKLPKKANVEISCIAVK